MPRFSRPETRRARQGRHLVFGAAAGLVLLLVAAQLHGIAAQPAASAPPPHHLAQGFRNLDASYSYSLLERTGHLVRRIGEAARPRGTPFARVTNDGIELRANGIEPTATWIGHATFLIQLDGVNILTDPTWAHRASPVRFVGPRRLVAPGLRFEDLPPIHAVVISHDHYDHLDADTVGRLARAHDPVFFVPLGLRPLLADVGARRVVELDWWESGRAGAVRFVCTPAQHSSGRTLLDQNERLWSSWAILGEARRFFFAGDTGYFAGFKDIGERLGPFDLAAMPIGGYSSYTKRHPNHVSPEEAVQAFEDVRGQLLVPMHWGTFAMNSEPYAEPPERLRGEAQRRGIAARMRVLAPGQTLHW